MIIYADVYCLVLLLLREADACSSKTAFICILCGFAQTIEVFRNRSDHFWASSRHSFALLCSAAGGCRHHRGWHGRQVWDIAMCVMNPNVWSCMRKIGVCPTNLVVPIVSKCICQGEMMPPMSCWSLLPALLRASHWIMRPLLDTCTLLPSHQNPIPTPVPQTQKQRLFCFGRAPSKEIFGTYPWGDCKA